MKRFLVILALFLVPVSAFATTTVTGTIKKLDGSVVTSGYVRLWLRGCGGAQPRVGGVALISPSPQGGIFYFDFPISGSGTISGTVYSTRDAAGTGNGDIDCGGSKISVWYGLQVVVAGRGGPETPIHANNGVTLDVTTVQPIVMTPPPAVPGAGIVGATGAKGDKGDVGTINANTGGVIGGSLSIKGPIPNRDMTSYFPIDGSGKQVCPVDFPAGGLRPDPATTASISSGSHALTIVGALSNFANGCGVAIPGAGPTSTVQPPKGGIGQTLGTVTRDGAGNGVVTCITVGCGFDLAGVANATWGAVLSNCSDASFNGTYPVPFGLTSGTTFTIQGTSGGGSTSNCTFTSLFGYTAGVTGSTDYKYCVVSIDSLQGYSACSSVIDIPTGNATVDWGNYNVIQFDPTTDASGVPNNWYGVYRAKDFPAVTVTDNFNRADGGLGTNWTTLTGRTAPTITSNQIAGNTGGTYQIAYRNAETFFKDQTSQAIYTGTTGGSAVGAPLIGVRLANGAGAQGYICQWFNGSVYITDVAGPLNLVNTTSSLTNGDTIKAGVSGSTITCYVNGASVLSTTNTSYTSGAPGIGVFGTGGFATVDSWTGHSDANSDYFCIGPAFENAFVDHGFAKLPCPSFLPATPPVAAGHQTLYTKVSSGGGTANIVTVDAASATVTAGKLYHDDSWAMRACLLDLSIDNGGTPFTSAIGSGSGGCYIPPGNYEFEGALHAPGVPATIVDNGGINILTQPLFVGGSHIICPVGSVANSQGQDFLACPIRVGRNVPACLAAVNGNNTYLDGLECDNLFGYGLWSNNSSGTFNHIAITSFFDSSSVPGPPSPEPIVQGANVLENHYTSLALSSASKGNPVIALSMQPYGQTADCCTAITHVKANFGNMLVECPGIAANSPTGIQNTSVTDFLMESTLNGGAIIDYDNRLVAPNPGRCGLAGVGGSGLEFTDAATATVYHEYDNNATNGVLTFVVGVSGNEAITCGPDPRLPNLPACTDLPAIGGSLDFVPTNLPINFSYILSTEEWRPDVPVNFQINNQNNVDTNIAWQQLAANPKGLYVFATGAGSLSAGTYCMFIVGEDNKFITFPTFFIVPGTTGKSNEVCQTVGASSSITLAQNMGGAAMFNYSNVRLYYGTAGPGSEAHYIETAQVSPIGYVFTSTSGNIAGTATDAKKDAALSFMYDHFMCLACQTATGNPVYLYPVVIGAHAWDQVSKVDILGRIRSDASAVTTPGIFTNTQMNEYAQSLINSCSPLTEFQATQGANFSTDALTGCLSVPVGATVYQAQAVAGYANTSSTTTNVPAGYFSCRALTNSSKCWGINSVIQDLAGLTTGVKLLNEYDVQPRNVASAYTSMNGALYNLFAPALADGTTFTNAFGPLCSKGVAGGIWQDCFVTSDGASADFGLMGSKTTSASSNSQGLLANTRDGGNVVRSHSIFADSIGSWTVNSFNGKVIFDKNAVQQATVDYSANTSARTYVEPDASGTHSLAVIENCGLTSGATQACAKTVQLLPIIVFGDVQLNTAASQAITTLPFTAAADYSCSGSDLSTPTGVVSFPTYTSGAQVTIQETNGANTDHLRYMCVGF